MRWQCWELAHFNRAFGLLAFEVVAKPRLGMGPSNQGLVEAMCLELARFVPVLECHLADRRYLVGDSLTIADYSMICFESYRPAVPFDWAPYPNLNAYFDRMRHVEAWTQAAPADSRAVGRKPKAA